MSPYFGLVAILVIVGVCVIGVRTVFRALPDSRESRARNRRLGASLTAIDRIDELADQYRDADSVLAAQVREEIKKFRQETRKDLLG